MALQVNSIYEREELMGENDDIDDPAFENEKCGICRDVIIDRGVLDCCNHWFCFPCIDNWAAITNLCPLCKNEFQLITCLPVYDTIGSANAEESSSSRDEDWYIQGNNNTLSFPSYYIDEDAVNCLDGDGCKIRSGFSVSEEGLTYDTSIACDSCDIWYHAFCVGFNPNTSESSWLCPRCVPNDAKGNLGAIPMQYMGQNTSLKNSNVGSSFNHSFSGKVSVSGVDTGDTAVVVSIIKDQNTDTSPSEMREVLIAENEPETYMPDNIDSNDELDVQLTRSVDIEPTDQNLIHSDRTSSANAPKIKNCSDIILNISPDVSHVQQDFHLKEKFPAIDAFRDSATEMTTTQPHNPLVKTSVPLTSSQDVLSYTSYTETHDDSNDKNTEKVMCFPFNIIDNPISSPLAVGSPDVRNRLPEDASLNSLPICLPMTQRPPVEKVVDDATDNEIIGNSTKFLSNNSSLSVEKVIVSTNNQKVNSNSEYSSKDLSVEKVIVATSNQKVSSNSEYSSKDLSVEKVIVATNNQNFSSNSEYSSKDLSDNVVSSTTDELDDIKCQENFEVNARKHMEKFLSHVTDVNHVKNRVKRKRETSTQVKMEGDSPAKKTKSDRKSQTLPSKCQVNSSVSESAQRCFSTATVSKSKLRHPPQKQDIAVDIMSIIQEADYKPSDGLGSRKSAGVAIGRRDDAARVRMKKIMHRVDDKKETSKLVQKLRNEIREAVQDKSSNNIGKDNAFDEKLLKAFQEALVKPKNESVLKSDCSFVRLKKSLLQKGKVRENLTKKIYATSSGRRRRAWDREWEVEFWKHRCKRTKTEKVETLQSVLELLKKATSENSEMDQRPEGENENSILSRVYLADASLFPRNDDIKPLSVLAGCSNVDTLKQNEGATKAGYSTVDNLKQNNGKGYINQSMKDSEADKNNIAQSPQGLSRVSLQKSASNTPGKKLSTSFIGDGACLDSNLDGPKSGAASISCSSRSIGSEHNSEKLTSQSETGKSDKRKWALEVLARKNALMNPNGIKEKQEENSSLKGNYPLLAQLPTDMRPVVAPSRHSKVPASVRQAQLYRITEHYLRRTDLTVIRRTADTELAVADAINVEKDIIERSSSKLVYINLCSQFLSQLSKKPQSVKTSASHSPETTTESTVQIVKESRFEDSPDIASKVEEALKLAGLSDSPPESPHITGKDLNGEYENRDNIQGETVENVLDIDSHPELDIFGDFEYDLEDEGYIIPSSNSTTGLSKVQENKESKMKVVLSTLRCEELNISLDFKHDSKKDQSSEGVGDDQYNSSTLEVAYDSSTLLEGKGECLTCDASVDVSTDVNLVLDPSQVGIYEELSLAEYEELYGPDKEPLANKISNDEVIGQPSNIELTAAINRERETEYYISKDGAPMSKSKTYNSAEKCSGATNRERETENCLSKDETPVPKLKMEKSAEKIFADGGAPFNHESFCKKNSPARSLIAEHVQEEGKAKLVNKKSPDLPCSVTKKVEAYVKEHIRPLCKSRVLNVEQYRWAVGKTTEKVMRYHYKAKNANFLIKDGEKVKKLADQYAEASTQQKKQ